MYTDLFLSKYTAHSPLEDIVKAECRSASMLSLTGRFDEALARIESLSPNLLRTLKINQYHSTYLGLLKLRRAIHHGDLSSADLLLLQLSSNQFPDPECALEIQMCEVDLHSRRGNFSAALNLTNALSQHLEKTKADIFPRARLMLLKAEIMAATGRPLKGLSLTLRAASIAYRARILPALFAAFVGLSIILNSLGEFVPAFSLLDTLMPPLLESHDSLLAARAYDTLADSVMGISGQHEGEERRVHMLRALEFMERAGAEWKKLGDKKMEARECMRRARVLEYVGERVLRDDVGQVWRGLRGDE